VSSCLGEVIRVLEAYPNKAKVLPIGFGVAMSYRGYYEDLAFEPEENVTVGVSLKRAKAALGKTFTGYKGGDFEMTEWTTVWLSRYGNCDGDAVGPVMLAYMLGIPLDDVRKLMEAP